MMKVIVGIISIVFVLGIGIGFSLNASAEEGLIPAWIKNTADFWVDGQIGDKEFLSALQYLVKEGILVIPNEENSSEVSSKYYGLTEEQVRNVKIIEDSCDSKTVEVEATVGKTAADVYAEKCEATIIKKIEEYRNSNSP